MGLFLLGLCLLLLSMTVRTAPPAYVPIRRAWPGIALSLVYLLGAFACLVLSAMLKG